MQRRAIDRRQSLQNFGLIFLVEIFEKTDRVIIFEILHAFGDGAGRQLFEDFIADLIFDFGQRREIEIMPHQLDELRAKLMVKPGDQDAQIGRVEIARERADALGQSSLHSLGDLVDKVRPNIAVFIV